MVRSLPSDGLSDGRQIPGGGSPKFERNVEAQCGSG